ncbi:hypothetical protein LTS18_003532, partial [Coniosporium uncinatum]
KGSRRGWDEGCEQDVLVPWVMKGQQKSSSSGPENADGTRIDKERSRTFQRYYHLYRKGELERDVEQASGVVVEAGYEKDNWWAIVAPQIQL